MNINKLEKLRKKKNFTQKEISKKIGVSQVAYNNSIKNNDFKVSELENIAKVLDVPVSYFFYETKEIQKDKNSINLNLKIESVKNEIKEFHTYISNILLEYSEHIYYKEDTKNVMKNITKMNMLFNIDSWHENKNINSYKDLTVVEKTKFLSDLSKINITHKMYYNSILVRANKFRKKLIDSIAEHGKIS